MLQIPSSNHVECLLRASHDLLQWTVAMCERTASDRRKPIYRSRTIRCEEIYAWSFL